MAANGVMRLARRAYNGLPDHVREDIRAKRAEFRGLLRIKDNQRMLVFAEWCATMELPPVANRKIWEFAYIAHMFDLLGVLEPGRSGLGFGVGGLLRKGIDGGAARCGSAHRIGVNCDEEIGLILARDSHPVFQ